MTRHVDNGASKLERVRFQASIVLFLCGDTENFLSNTQNYDNNYIIHDEILKYLLGKRIKKKKCWQRVVTNDVNVT